MLYNVRLSSEASYNMLSFVMNAAKFCLINGLRHYSVQSIPTSKLLHHLLLKCLIFQSEVCKKTIVCMSVQIQVCLAWIVLPGIIFFNTLKLRDRGNMFAPLTVTYIWEKGQKKSI